MISDELKWLTTSGKKMQKHLIFLCVMCSRNEEGVVDDDATEVMSDVDSQETVDYNSDDTTVLDSQAIDKCTKKLMERFTNKVK